MAREVFSKSINSFVRQDQPTKMKIGKNGEELAEKYYTDQGFSLVCKNFQYYRKGQSGRNGEIDLIFSKGNVLHLVEVKTRTNQKFGLAISQINQAKIRLLFNTYQYFVTKFPHFKNFLIQFDVATIDSGELKIHRNAMTFDGLGM